MDDLTRDRRSDYEAPRLLRLAHTDGSHAVCDNSGSSLIGGPCSSSGNVASSTCSGAGNFADGGCGTGSTPILRCFLGNQDS